MDCGPTCLRMIAEYYGKSYSLSYLRDQCYVTREGASLLALREGAVSIGLQSSCVSVSLDYLDTENVLPCIAHWDNNHFVVIYKINKDKVYVADPAHGKIKYKKEMFLKHWSNAGNNEGYALLLEPSSEFYTNQENPPRNKNFIFLFSYLKPYYQLLTQLIIGMIIASMIQLVLPFLTQMIVDKGINNRNIGFLKIILAGQLILISSRIFVNHIRSWLLFYISTPVNISLVYDFLIKLIRLPISFFDTKMLGDILQRVGDHQRIEYFITNSFLNIALTVINIIVFSVVLIIYNFKIFIIFAAGTAFYLIWILLFLKKRREIDYYRFKETSKNQNMIIQLIMGMQEIKLNLCHNKKIRNWIKIQDDLFLTGIKSLSLTQKQQSGCTLIQESQNIIITFISAYSVIQGDITLGMMLAIQFIIGQLNGPVDQLVHFIAVAQDAKLSFERIDEIHQKQDEEDTEKMNFKIIPDDADIVISDLSFQYGDPYSEKVLKNVSFVLPNKKITAIVGSSGSGKTTLLKLLLGFYQPVSGEIKIGEIPIKDISCSSWREKCGLVMQDGYIFSETIAENIALKDEIIDQNRLQQSAEIANIDEFIKSLPSGYNTKIGAEGHGLSQGQKQRVLIARAVYKNPEYIFFDEATNSLDANNEYTIMKNLDLFFHNRTVVIVAHRLSTVKNADKIIVLNKGSIEEVGTHNELINLKGFYYELVKNQLELGI